MKTKPKAAMADQGLKDPQSSENDVRINGYHVAEVGDRPLALTQRISDAHAIAILLCPAPSDG